MRRPTHTRRLSIAAIVSLLASVAVAAIGIRSFRIPSEVKIGLLNKIGVEAGYVTCFHVYQTTEVRDQSGNLEWPSNFRWIGCRFRAGRRILYLGGEYTIVECGIQFPLWFPLLLLLIAPVLWLIARPANEPAFLVVTDAKQEREIMSQFSGRAESKFEP